MGEWRRPTSSIRTIIRIPLSIFHVLSLQSIYMYMYTTYIYNKATVSHQEAIFSASLPSVYTAFGCWVSAKHIYFSVATSFLLVSAQGMLEGDCKSEGESIFSFLLPLGGSFQYHPATILYPSSGSSFQQQQEIPIFVNFSKVCRTSLMRPLSWQHPLLTSLGQPHRPLHWSQIHRHQTAATSPGWSECGLHGAILQGPRSQHHQSNAPSDI